ncbi:MAG: hypothetical protein ACRCWL_07420 [Aeromonas sp.]
MIDTVSIEISKSTFDRLSSLAVGFDTPDAVINRLINHSLGQSETKPRIMFIPSEAEFKRLLLQTRVAEAKIYHSDGRHFVVPWNATKLQSSSNLRANLWSGFLRNWKQKKISKVELSTLELGYDLKLLTLSHALGLTYEEAKIVQPEMCKESDDTYLVSFKHENMDILKNVTHKLDSDLNVYLPSCLID